MAIAAGVNKSVRIKKESVFGTAPGATGAVLLRRVTSGIDLVKDTYESAEIVSTFQRSDFRHGTRRVEGSIDGELSPGTYQLLLAAALRKDFVAGATTGAITTVTAAVGPPGTFTRSAGSYLTDGFKVGDIVRWTGWATGGTNNNARNYRITVLTATVMTVTGLLDEVVAAKASGDSVTCTVVGKKSFTPATGHTNDSFSVEHWFSDVALSELFTGCRVRSLGVRLPATGLGTLTIGLLGQNITTAGAAYYTSPTAAPTTGIVAAVNGALRFGGSDIATVTGIELNLDGGMTTEAVVGSNQSPDVFPGIVAVSGQVTVLFENATLRDLFLDETEAELWSYLRLSSAINSDFLSFHLPRIKLGGAQKSDGLQGLVQTMPFTALYNSAGGSGLAGEATTLTIQDSTL
jgi:hypothetical protein